MESRPDDSPVGPPPTRADAGAHPLARARLSVAIACSPFLSVFSSFRGVMRVWAQGSVSGMDSGGKPRHIILTSHPGGPGAQASPIVWGAASARERGPIVATTANAAHRNAIGTHSGSYGVYRA